MRSQARTKSRQTSKSSKRHGLPCYGVRGKEKCLTDPSGVCTWRQVRKSSEGQFGFSSDAKVQGMCMIAGKYKKKYGVRRVKTPLQREWSQYVQSKGLPKPGENPCSDLGSDQCEELPICQYREASGCGFRKGARQYLGSTSKGLAAREYWERYAELKGVPKEKCTASYERKNKCDQPYCYWRTGPQSSTCATRRSVPLNWPVRGRRPRLGKKSSSRSLSPPRSASVKKKRSSKGKANTGRPSNSSIRPSSAHRHKPLSPRRSNPHPPERTHTPAHARAQQQPAGGRVRRQVEEIEARERAAAPTFRYGIQTAAQRRRRL